MTAEPRREVGLNMMIGAGVIGGVAVAHPVGNIIGRTISGAPIPWETYGWIYLLVALPAAVAWLIGRAVWARAWRGGNTPSDALCGDLSVQTHAPGVSGRVDETERPR